MATQKTLNTRIKLKVDSLSQWQTLNPVLLDGEIAIARVETVEGTTLQPVMFKVGNGTANFNSLDWASAKAADVYGWAKKSGIEVEDTGTGKFVTGMSWDATKQALVLTRADVDWTDIQNKPDFANLYQAKGNYKTVQEAITANENDGTKTLKVGQNTNGEISVELVDIVFPAPVDISGKKDKQEAVNETGSTTQTITGISQNENGEISVTFGNIAFPEDKDTNTAHSHSAGDGTIVTDDGGIEGEVKVNLNIALSLDNKTIKLTDKTDTSKVLAELDATSFIKDGMIESVELVQTDDKGNDGQFLKITWNDDGNDIVYLDITTLVDTYTGTDGIEINNYEVKIANNGVTTDKIADKNVTEAKLSDAVTTKLNKVWQEVGDYETKTDASAKLAEAKGYTNTEIGKEVTARDAAIATALEAAKKYADDNDTDTTYTAADGGGLKLEGTVFSIDETVTFIFDCGNATV